MNTEDKPTTVTFKKRFKMKLTLGKEPNYDKLREYYFKNELFFVDTAKKLKPFIDELLTLFPTTTKIQVEGEGETWIVETADPDAWSGFYDAFDGFMVKMKELLESLK